MSASAARRQGGRQPRHSTTLVCFVAALVLDAAFAVLQLSAMLTAPAWQGNVQLSSVVALALTVLVALVPVAGFYLEWRRVIPTPRLYNLAVACLSLPVLLVVVGVLAA